MNEKRGAGLRYPAAACEGEILEEKISRDERAEHRDENSPPTRSAWGEHESSEAAGKQNECNDDQPYQRSDEEAEQQREAIFLAPEVFDQLDQARRQSSDSYGWHFLKLNASMILSKRSAHALFTRDGEAMASSPSGH
jgi:hypothetical protein